MTDETIEIISAFIIIAVFIMLLFIPLYFKKKELDKECNRIFDNHKYLSMLIAEEQERIRKQKEDENK